MARKPPKKNPKSIETLSHDEAKRINIPTSEYQMVAQDNLKPASTTYKRGDEALKEEKEARDREQDPQLIWHGKDLQDYSDLIVNAPPLHIQEKVHPKTLIDDLQSRSLKNEIAEESEVDLFSDFNGLPDNAAKTEFYQHDDVNWANRMILGDSLQVMASLIEREELRGKVQCIYFDPPYGIKFNSNFQWSTNVRKTKEARIESITREPEMVKAYRDTWRYGVHSYLTYARDRLTVARDLLADSGSIFVQIGDENVHRVRALMDQIFDSENFVNQINCRTNSGTTRSNSLKRSCDYLLWYAKKRSEMKFRRLTTRRGVETTMYNQLLLEDLSTRSMTKSEKKNPDLISKETKIYRKLPLHSMSAGKNAARSAFGKEWSIPNNRSWRHSAEGFERLLKANRIQADKTALSSRYFHTDYPVSEFSETWVDTGPEINKSYVVQTSELIVQRAILMTTDPGDLVLDPTCGSGTTAYVAEQWARRWITIDTSRVSLALARARIMGARYPYYLLSDSSRGQAKEAALTESPLSARPTYNSINLGFVYERVPHITLKSVANNVEIDVIWDRFQAVLESCRLELNRLLQKSWEEWEIPHQADADWPSEVKKLHKQLWEQRKMRQREIDASIGAKADFEYLYDKPYEDKSVVRVAGRFTVESLSPHRYLSLDEEDNLIDDVMDTAGDGSEAQSFVQMILENLKKAGVQQAHKENKLNFVSLVPWPGRMICAEGQYSESEKEEGKLKRAAIFVGPEFGTASRPDLVEAAREAVDADFDVLVACAFNYDAHSTEFDTLGSLPVLKARMNADLHMAGDLKNTGKGNLFVIFGEPDIEVLYVDDGKVQVKIEGVDVFHPNSGEVRSDGADGIACWFVDTNYNEESFFVRQAYFLGANDPYKSLKSALKAEIDEDAWATLNRDISRPFAKPSSGRIAVKVINHLGDEVMKVYKIS